MRLSGFGFAVNKLNHGWRRISIHFHVQFGAQCINWTSIQQKLQKRMHTGTNQLRNYITCPLCPPRCDVGSSSAFPKALHPLVLLKKCDETFLDRWGASNGHHLSTPHCALVSETQLKDRSCEDRRTEATLRAIHWLLKWANTCCHKLVHCPAIKTIQNQQSKPLDHQLHRKYIQVYIQWSLQWLQDYTMLLYVSLCSDPKGKGGEHTAVKGI